MKLRARRLTGSVVVVTGASSGIGRATALAFAGHRTRLVLTARSAHSLETVAALCRVAGAEAVTVPVDLSADGAADQVVQAALGAFGRVDVWVNAAGLLVAGGLPVTPIPALRRLIDTNVTGVMLASRAALQRFEAQGSGVLVNVASMLAVIPNPLVPSYVMSKAAVRGLTLALRQAVWSQPDVHVCLVLPGPVDTPMFQHAANHTGHELRAIPPAYAPERLAAAIVGCARRPRRQVTAGAVARLMLAGHRLAPRPTEWALGQYSQLLLLRPSSAPAGDGALHVPHHHGVVHGGWRLGATRRRLGGRWGRWLADRGADRSGPVAVWAPMGGEAAPQEVRP